MGFKFTFDDSTCIQCGVCGDSCPVNALDFTRPSEILKGLSDTGIIRKSESRKEGSIHTSYRLTKSGAELEEIIKSLKSFGTKAYGNSPLCKDRKCAECSLFSYCASD